MSDWTDILEYRDFYDVPRLFSVSILGNLYLLDCEFSEALDEYPDEYSVYEMVGTTNPNALLADWCEEPRPSAILLGRIPVSSVTFDSSRRRQVDMRVLKDLTKLRNE